MSELMIGWTTAPNDRTAKHLAEGLVKAKLAACVQVIGPMMSHYVWKGRHEVSQEFRLTVKFLEFNHEAIKSWLNNNHPYDVPEWIAFNADKASAEYLNWVQEVAPERWSAEE